MGIALGQQPEGGGWGPYDQLNVWVGGGGGGDWGETRCWTGDEGQQGRRRDSIQSISTYALRLIS